MNPSKAANLAEVERLMNCPTCTRLAPKIAAALSLVRQNYGAYSAGNRSDKILSEAIRNLEAAETICKEARSHDVEEEINA